MPRPRNDLELQLIKTVLDTAWAYGAIRFLESVLARTGQSFEGAVWFGYYVQYPDELAEGVTLGFLDEELVLSEREFDAVVLKDALERLSAKADEGLNELLRKLGGRIETLS